MNSHQKLGERPSMLFPSTSLRVCALLLLIAVGGMLALPAKAEVEQIKPETVEFLNQLGLGELGNDAARLNTYARATWQTGPASVKLGKSVVLQMPAGARWLEPAQVEKIEKAHGVTVPYPSWRIQSGDAWTLTLFIMPTGHMKDVALPWDIKDLAAKRLQPWPVQEDFTIGRHQRYTPDKLKWLKDPSYDPATHMASYAYTTGDDVHPRERHHMAAWLRLGAREVLVAALDGPYDSSIDTRLKSIDEFMSRVNFLEGHRYADAGLFDKNSETNLTRLIAGPPTVGERAVAVAGQKDPTKLWWLIAAALTVVSSLIWGRQKDGVTGPSGAETKASATQQTNN